MFFCLIVCHECVGMILFAEKVHAIVNNNCSVLSVQTLMHSEFWGSWSSLVGFTCSVAVSVFTLGECSFAWLWKTTVIDGVILAQLVRKALP